MNSQHRWFHKDRPGSDTPTSWNQFPSGKWPRPCPSGIGSCLVQGWNEDQRVGSKAETLVSERLTCPHPPTWCVCGGSREGTVGLLRLRVPS